MSRLKQLLWLGALVVGTWFFLQWLAPKNARQSWQSIENYCLEATRTQVNSEADANSLATGYGLTPQRSVDDQNRVQILVLRPALLGTDVSCRLTFEGSSVNIEYSEPGGIAGLIVGLMR